MIGRGTFGGKFISRRDMSGGGWKRKRNLIHDCKSIVSLGVVADEVRTKSQTGNKLLFYCSLLSCNFLVFLVEHLV